MQLLVIKTVNGKSSIIEKSTDYVFTVGQKIQHAGESCQIKFITKSLDKAFAALDTL